MIKTVKSLEKNNFQTLTWSLNRGLFIYRLQLYSSRESYLATDLIPLRINVITSIIECKCCVINVKSCYDENFYRLDIICSSELSPEVFSSRLDKIIPGLVIEELKNSGAVSVLEKQMSGNFCNHNRLLLEIKESRNILVTLLLEHKALIFSINQSPCKSGFTKGFFMVPFIFFYYKKLLCGIPEFMVGKLFQQAKDVVLKFKDLGTTELDNVHIEFKEKIDVASLIITEKKEPGIYRALSGKMDFHIIIPGFMAG